MIALGRRLLPGAGVDRRAVVALTPGLEAIPIAGSDTVLEGIRVEGCASIYAFNAPAAVVRLRVAGSVFAEGALGVKGPQAHVTGNRFDGPVGRFEGPGNVFTGNAVTGTVIVTAQASALAATNTFGPGGALTFEGGSLYDSAAFANAGLTGTGPNHIPLAGGALHADAAGHLRIKTSRFASDTDGVVVGSQG